MTEKNGFRKMLEKREALEVAMGATALQDLRRYSDQEARRIKAEDEAAHKLLWGKDMPEEDDLGDVILGDSVTNVTQPANPFSKLAGQALLAAAIGLPLAYVATKYFESPRQAAPQIQDTDTDTANEFRIFRP